ncbi:MAG: YcxB family protein [Caulobacteraceae bacterium]|nr:MAG: YcxB family protein [Caulobacteraceae bacterium]
MEATGIMAVGESAAALAYIRTRRGLSPRQSKAILLLGMLAVGLPVAAWTSGSWLFGVLAVEGAIAGLIVGVLIVHALTGPTLRKALATRGQSATLPMTLRLSPASLTQDLGDVILTARWSCLTDVFRTPKHWVFLIQSSAIVLPRHFFATAEAERVFLAEVVARMPEAARARSADAVRAAGG